MNKKFRKILISLAPIAIGILLPLSKVEMFIDGKSKKNLFRTGLIKNIFRVSQCGKQDESIIEKRTTNFNH